MELEGQDAVIGPKTLFGGPTMKNPTSKEMRECAQNCGDLAQDAKKTQERKRFQRMQEAWTSLAHTQDWLDGKAALDERSKD
jgi:hypothetical protein